VAKRSRETPGNRLAGERPVSTVARRGRKLAVGKDRVRMI